MITKTKRKPQKGDYRLRSHFCLFPFKVYEEDGIHYFYVWLQSIWCLQKYQLDCYESSWDGRKKYQFIWKTERIFLSKEAAEEYINGSNK